ncbi:tumor necrosis factor-inducible gene 6 protein-like [Mytilus edulis]|uniref:tumor necrosis factor-inducible gene 6 protein-like n=1 Tax=Mytilus edulis TaxID=6550 RepID=UPI0039EF6A1A
MLEACKSSCDESEEDTGFCCKEYRCCQHMASCNDREDSTCRDTCNIGGNEYIDITTMCSDNTKCCRLCNEQCGGSFTGPMGSFFSPNSPSNYCNRQHCLYTITVEEGSIIMVIFSNVFLEIEGDYVEIYDAEIKPEALLYYINVNEADKIEVNSTSNRMIIRFVSDRSLTYAGFRVNYKAI